MLPQLGFSEFLLIAIAALVVVGPRDLPGMLRKAGALVARARGMAREFQGAFEDMGREVELEELRQEIAQIKKANPVADLAEEIRQAETELRDEAADHTPR